MSQWRHGLLTSCFVTGALLQVLAAAAHQLLETGAVPGDEFYFAGKVYAHLDAIEITAGVLGIAGLLDLLVRGRRRFLKSRGSVLELLSFGLLLGAVLLRRAELAAFAVVVRWMSGLLERGRVLLERPEDDPQLGALDQAVRSIDLRSLLCWLVPLWTICTLGVCAVTLAESFIYTGRFVALFDGADLLQYRWRLLPMAAQCALAFAALYLALPALLAILRSCAAMLRMDPRHSVLLVATVQGLYMSFLLALATQQMAGDELSKNAVVAESLVLVLLCFWLWFTTIESAFRALGHGMPGSGPADAGLLLRVAAVAPLSLPLHWLGRRLVEAARRSHRRYFLVQVLGAAAWQALFTWLCFPDLEDFRSYFLSIGVFTAIHIMALGLVALSSAALPASFEPRLRPVLGTGALLVLLLAVDYMPMRGDVPLILAEYARFGYVVSKTGIKHHLMAPNRLGYEASDAPFAFRETPEDLYPEVSASNLVKSQPRPEPATPVEAIGTNGSDGVATDDTAKAVDLPPIVLILWDAGRPDHMGCYGYHRPTTPNADRLAADSVVFERAYSMATATTCGVRHFFTGRYSSRYMLKKDHEPFFVHALRRHGYHTFFVVALGSDFNGVSLDSFLRGGPPPDSDGARFINLGLHPRGSDAESPDFFKVEAVLEAWKRDLDERGPRALDGSLTFLHLTGTHFPWFNEDHDRDFGTDMVALYDGEMATVDRLTGTVLDFLRECGAYQRSIVLLFADHGTGLLEHGRWGGFFPYEEQIRIPLLIKMPGVVPGRSPAVVGTIDVAPTLLGLFEKGSVNPHDGVSLIPSMIGAARGSAPDPPRRYLASMCAFEDAYALIEDGRWKLHFHREESYWMLYDLESDPGERRNLFDERPDVGARLMKAMHAFLWDGRRGYANPSYYRDWTPPLTESRPTE